MRLRGPSLDVRGPLARAAPAAAGAWLDLIRQRSIDSNADSNAADRASACTTFEPCWSAVSWRQRTLRLRLRIRMVDGQPKLR